jgi:hypothetical protein
MPTVGETQFEIGHQRQDLQSDRRHATHLDPAARRQGDRTKTTFAGLHESGTGILRRSKTVRVESRGLNLAGLESSAMSQDAPSNAGELVGERDGENVVMQSALRRFDPRLEPIALPMFWPDPDQHHPGRIHHASRRRGGCMASRGARATVLDRKDRLPISASGIEPRWFGLRFRPAVGGAADLP